MSSYNPTFNRNSKGKFDSNLNFISIKGGSDAFLLEDEVNELQWLQNEARANLIREITNSGCLYINGVSNTHLKGGILLPGTTDLNAFTLYGFQTVINGYLLNIDNVLNSQFINNHIQLPSPPNVDIRYDFVYLEVWFSELKENQPIYELGGINNNLATFEFIDTRVNVLTSRRVQLKWALRVFDPTLDPSGMGIDKNTYDKGFINSNTMAVNPYINAITDHTTPITNYNFVPSENDPNLFITGTGSDSDKIILNSIDGYVYAIPLFFIDRYNSAPYDTILNPNGGVQYLYNHTSDRPDGRFSDVIYEDKLTDLREQAYLSKEQYQTLFVSTDQLNDLTDRVETLEGEYAILNPIVINDVLLNGFENSLGFNNDGTKPDFTSENYIDSTDNIMTTLNKIDAAIKAVDEKDLDLSQVVSIPEPNKILRLDSNGNLPTNITGSAPTLTTARNISLSSDATGSTSFNGSTNVNIALTLASTGVIPNTYKSVTVDGKGRVTGGTNPTTLAEYGITDAVNISDFNALSLTVNNLIQTVFDMSNQVNDNTDAIASITEFLSQPPWNYSPLSLLDIYNIDMRFNNPGTSGGFVNPDNTVNSIGIQVNEPFGVYTNYAVAYLPCYVSYMIGKLGEIWVEKADNLYLFKNSGYSGIIVDTITFKVDGITVKSGVETFNNATGIKITTPIAATDFIFITQLECGYADTGETYVVREIDNSGFIVYNTGAAVSDFEWMVIDTTSLTYTDLTDVVLNGIDGVLMAEPDYGSSYKVLVGPPDRPTNDGGIGEITIDKGTNMFTIYNTGSEAAIAQCLVFKQKL